MWNKNACINTDIYSMLNLAACLSRLWDISDDDALLLMTAHQGALAQATAQQHTIFQTAFTLGRLDLESPDSIILTTLGTNTGGNDDA